MHACRKDTFDRRRTLNRRVFPYPRDFGHIDPNDFAWHYMRGLIYPRSQLAWNLLSDGRQEFSPEPELPNSPIEQLPHEPDGLIEVQAYGYYSPPVTALSPDGKVLALSQASLGVSQVHFWDVIEGTKLSEVDMGIEGTTAMAFEPTGDILYVAEASGSSIVAWRVSAARRMWQVKLSEFEPDTTITELQVSSEGDVLACEIPLDRSRSCIAAMRTNSAGRIKQFFTSTELYAHISDWSLSPDGMQIAFKRDEHTLVVSPTFHEGETLEHPLAELEGEYIAFLSQDRLVVEYPETCLTCFEVLPQSLIPRERLVSQDGSLDLFASQCKAGTLVTPDYNGAVRVAKMIGPALRSASLLSSGHTMNSLMLSNDGTRLAAIDSRGTVLAWDISASLSPEELRVECHSGVEKVAFCGDTSHVLVPSRDDSATGSGSAHTLALYDISGPTRDEQSSRKLEAVCVQNVPPCRSLVSQATVEGGMVCVSLSVPVSSDHDAEHHGGTVDDDSSISVAQDAEITQLVVMNGSGQHTVELSPPAPFGERAGLMSISPDGSRAAYTIGANVYLFDLHRMTQVGHESLDPGYSGAIQEICVLPNTQRVLVMALRQRDSDWGVKSHELHVHPPSSEGTHAVGTQAIELLTCSADVTCSDLRVSSDGSFAVALARAKSRPNTTTEFFYLAVELVGSDGMADVRYSTHPLCAIAVSGDAKTIALGREDGSVALRQFRTGELLYEWPARPGDLVSLDFSPNDTKLAAGYKDGTIVVWTAEKAHRPDWPPHLGLPIGYTDEE